MKWFVLLAAIVLNASANVLLKGGMLKLGDFEFSFRYFVRALTNGYLISGVMSFALALIAYSISLTRFELSVAYPLMTSLGFIIVGLSSYLWFKEDIGAIRIVGMLIILLGVYLVAKDAA